MDVETDESNDVGARRLARIVAEKVDRLERISLQDAIERMESGRLSSFVFRNGGTERINILHERSDGSTDGSISTNAAYSGAIEKGLARVLQQPDDRAKHAKGERNMPLTDMLAQQGIMPGRGL